MKRYATVLALGLILLLVVVLFFFTFTRTGARLINKVGVPVAPPQNNQEATYITTKESAGGIPSTADSVRGVYTGLSNQTLSLTMTGPDGSAQAVNWRVDDATVVNCMEDLYKAPDGTIQRRSNMAFAFKNGYNPTLTNNKGLEWFKANVKKSSIVWTFGERTNGYAKAVYLFMDKCR